jgi:hypothetical protein
MFKTAKRASLFQQNMDENGRKSFTTLVQKNDFFRRKEWREKKWERQLQPVIAWHVQDGSHHSDSEHS